MPAARPVRGVSRHLPPTRPRGSLGAEGRFGGRSRRRRPERSGRARRWCGMAVRSRLGGTGGPAALLRRCGHLVVRAARRLLRARRDGPARPSPPAWPSRPACAGVAAGQPALAVVRRTGEPPSRPWLAAMFPIRPRKRTGCRSRLSDHSRLPGPTRLAPAADVACVTPTAQLQGFPCASDTPREKIVHQFEIALGGLPFLRHSGEPRSRSPGSGPGQAPGIQRRPASAWHDTNQGRVYLLIPPGERGWQKGTILDAPKDRFSSSYPRSSRGQTRRKPVSIRWIPACAGMTQGGILKYVSPIGKPRGDDFEPTHYPGEPHVDRSGDSSVFLIVSILKFNID